MAAAGRRFLPLLLTLGLLLFAALPVFGGEGELTLLLTHDLHSNLDPLIETRGGLTTERGGFARLKTAVDSLHERFPQALILDGGDFSMGTLYQTLYTSEAAELRMLGALGVEATTLGNHEFDYRPAGAASMLRAAKASGETLPALLLANIDAEATLADPTLAPAAADLLAALDEYGRRDYALFERDGQRVAVFGLIGREALEYSPLAGLRFADPTATAKRVVAEIKRECPEVAYIIALSHSGTNKDKGKSEDELLAAAVPELSLILSAHSHTTLAEPIVSENGTVICSTGEYGRNLGFVRLRGRELLDYELIPIDTSLEKDAAVQARIDSFRAKVEGGYLARHGYSFDEPLVRSSFAFAPFSTVINSYAEQPLGNLVADSYRYAVKQLEGEAYRPITVTMVPSGLIRATLGEGTLTVADAFNVSSLGLGEDGTPGYPLVSFYLTGADLRMVAEIDASVSQLMPTAKLHFRGLAYTQNPARLPLDRVTELRIEQPDGSYVMPEKDTLYRVVCGYYSLQMMGAVEAKSHGLLSVIPRDETGAPITDFASRILHDDEGDELKEWAALAAYLEAYGKSEGGALPDYYRTTHARKQSITSYSPTALLGNPNRVGLLLYAALAAALALLGLAFWLVRRQRKKRLPPEQMHKAVAT